MTELGLAMIFSLLLQPPCVGILRRVGAIDVPGSRSSHTSPVPRGGGVAVVVAAVAGLAVAAIGGVPDPNGVLVLAVTALVLLGTLGLVEDIRGMTVARRLVALAGAGLVLDGIAMALGASPLVGVGLLLAVVVYANAFNFMDGVNAISGLNAAVAGASYAMLGAAYDVPAIVVLGLVIAGAALGFLPYNAPRARVFLGDAGSYALGGVIAVMAIAAAASGLPTLLCAAPLTVYLADTGWTLARRAQAGQPVLEAHREHVYQQLADTPLGHVGAALLNAGAGFACTGLVWMSVWSDTAWPLLAAAGVVVGYLLSPRLLAAAGLPVRVPASGGGLKATR